MRIARIFAHRVDLPLVEGSYQWSGGKSVSVFDSTIVGVETECGLTGYGEVCPLGPFYLPAYAEGVRAGLKELSPHLIGFDPRELLKLNHRMDAALKGHPYVKSGIDVACWDLLGKATQLPVCTLMGGRFGEKIRLYRAISQLPPEEMAANVASYRAQGYTRFQLKVGDVTTAAIAHLAHSTPEELRFTSTDFNSYVTVSNASGAPQRLSGFMQASDTQGLGIEPRFEVLGKRLVEVS